MAKRQRHYKKKMYRKLTEHHYESTSAGGGWSSVFKIQKDTLDRHGGYAKSCKINYILDDIDGADSLRDSFPFGVMWAATLDDQTRTVDGSAAQLEPKYILDVTARQGGGGVASLNLAHFVRENSRDLDELDGEIYIFMKCTDLTVDDNLKWRMYIETMGRYVTNTPL